VAPLDGASAHVPSAAPIALLQAPAQHSISVTHVSPVCVQNETPFEHNPFEQ
jgi:hypothetical protein